MSQRRNYVVVDGAGTVVFSGSCVNDLNVKGSGNGLRWTRGVAPFTIFCEEEGRNCYGYVGTSDCLGFVDDNFGPDYSVSPPAEISEAA